MSVSTRDIVEATGIISVLAGLLLVAYQINQATSIASAQARAEYSAGWRSVDSTRQSENFAEVLAKSIYHPNAAYAGRNSGVGCLLHRHPGPNSVSQS